MKRGRHEHFIHTQCPLLGLTDRQCKPMAVWPKRPTIAPFELIVLIGELQLKVDLSSYHRFRSVAGYSKVDKCLVNNFVPIIGSTQMPTNI